LRLGKLASSRVLFLREEVRDLRVQEFLRELVVGVAATSGLARSFLVEILIAVKAEKYRKWLELRSKSPVFAIALLSLSTHLCLISCMLVLFLSLYASYLLMHN